MLCSQLASAKYIHKWIKLIIIIIIIIIIVIIITSGTGKSKL